MGGRYVWRSKNFAPSSYERALGAALFGILKRNIHELHAIVGALNETEVRPPGEASWTEANFSSQMEQLGPADRAVGAPLGSHT